MDNFIYRNPDLLVLIAAGNNGDRAAESTVLDPATAKNALIVGACSASLSAWSEYSFFMDILLKSSQTPKTTSSLWVNLSLGTIGVGNQSLYYSSDVLAYFSSIGPTAGWMLMIDCV